MFCPPVSKVFFLKLLRIPASFLKLLWIFLTLENHFSTPLCSFYSKVISDGTQHRELFAFHTFKWRTELHSIFLHAPTGEKERAYVEKRPAEEGRHPTVLLLWEAPGPRQPSYSRIGQCLHLQRMCWSLPGTSWKGVQEPHSNRRNFPHLPLLRNPFTCQPSLLLQLRLSIYWEGDSPLNVNTQGLHREDDDISFVNSIHLLDLLAILHTSCVQ